MADADVRWIRCGGCQGEVGIPVDWSEPTATCPKCGASVKVAAGEALLWRPTPEANVSSKPVVAEQTKQRPPGIAYRGVEWMKPASVVSLLVAAAGAIASFNYGAGRPFTLEGALLAAALNPLFFVGLPLAIYWWSRSMPGFQCPACGRRNAWSWHDMKGYPAGTAVKCTKCDAAYRIPPPT